MKAITEEQGLHKEWYERAKKMTMDDLPEFLRELTEDYNHDYGTICHAVASSAIAAAWAVERTPHCGGITGFQAGAIMWEMIEAWGVFGKGQKKIVCYNDMLYPQYASKFAPTISEETWTSLQVDAKKNLGDSTNGTHPDVIAHWKSIVDGTIPFGYTIEAPDA